MSVQQSALDENMIPGQTYTFKLNLENTWTRPSTSTLQKDLQANAPSFVNNNMQVTLEDQGLNPLNWTTNVYDIQFTYNGDGSDVVNDVWTSIQSTIKTGSNDDFTLIGAYADVAAAITPTNDVLDQITNKASDVLNKATQGVADAANKVTAQAGKSAQDVLTPIEIAVGIVVVLVVILIFTAGKSGGVSGGPEGFKVG